MTARLLRRPKTTFKPSGGLVQKTAVTLIVPARSARDGQNPETVCCAIRIGKMALFAKPSRFSFLDLEGTQPPGPARSKHLFSVYPASLGRPRGTDKGPASRPAIGTSNDVPALGLFAAGLPLELLGVGHRLPTRT
jgi:hypothetical protein